MAVTLTHHIFFFVSVFERDTGAQISERCAVAMILYALIVAESETKTKQNKSMFCEFRRNFVWLETNHRNA